MELPSITEINFHKELLRVLREAETWAREIISKEKPEFNGIDSLNFQDFLDLSDALKQIDDHKEYPEFHKIQKLLGAYAILIALDRFPPDDSSKALYIAYLIGVTTGYFQAFEKDKMHTKIYEKFIHSNVTGKILKETRYKAKNELYQEALAYAENSWKEGDELLHHQMVQEILKMETFKELYKPRLLKEIKPIAQKYDRFWNPNASKKE